MTDKVQKIRAFLVGIADADGVSTILARAIEKKILPYIDSLQEELVSEVLDEAAFDYAESCKYEGGEKLLCIEHFKAGAKWQKNHLWKPADGDDLPEIDREVIALVAYDFGHYKVVYAHRPNHNGRNGTNIDTGEEEHFEPEIYGKGGWSQPHVLYWLDAKLPYEENKIDK